MKWMDKNVIIILSFGENRRDMYDSFSEEYDHFVNWPGRLAYELPFLMEQISSTMDKPVGSTRILDTATSTGMHAIALAQKGYVTSGVDISEGMINLARKNAKSAGVDVFFTTAAFGEAASRAKTLPAGKGLPFDVVLCLGNSLPHVDGEVDLQDALDDFSSCLRPGGLLILQNRNFDSVISTKDRWMEPQSYSDANGEKIYVRFYDFLPDGHIQFNILTLKRAPEGQWKQSVMGTKLYPISRDVLVQSLETAGFCRIQLYGALANTPFDSKTSGNLVVTAIKQ